jgi:DNA-binding transcriptional regulator PaaX
MKGKQTLVVLNVLAAREANSYDLLQKLFAAEYEATYRREVKEHGREMAVKKMRARYHNFLYKLKREGLVMQHGSASGITFAISRKGRAKLALLQGRESFPDKKKYDKDPGAGATIITFDISERDRKKRDWFRSVLRHLGFTMVQRSVWVGTTRIPLALLRDLQDLNLLEHVEAFQVLKVGNLKKLSLQKL